MTDVKYITVDSEWRTMTIPAGEEILGVYNDRDVEVKHFKVPRYYDEVDLGDFTVRINFRVGNGPVDSSYAEGVSADDEYITFKWTVPARATATAGVTLVQLCFRLTENNEVVKEYNTTYWSAKVLPGIEPDGSEIPTDPAIVTSMELLAASAQQAASDAEASAEQAHTTLVNIAAGYDPELTYAIGDYVIHDGVLYICGDAVEEPEAWTASRWIPVILTTKVKDLETGAVRITGPMYVFPSDSDLPITGGMYYSAKTFATGVDSGTDFKMPVLNSNNKIANIFLPVATATEMGIVTVEEKGTARYAVVRYDSQAHSSLHIPLVAVNETNDTVSSKLRDDFIDAITTAQIDALFSEE